MQSLRSGKLVIDLYAALIIAMLGGRVITGILRALIFAGGSYSWSAWAHLLPVRYAAVSATAEAEAA